MNQSLRTSAAHVFVEDITQPVLIDEDFAHLSKSLRLRDGESVSVSDGKGSWRFCVWRNNEHLELMSDVETHQRMEPQLAIAVSPVKGDRTDLAVEKMTEIGVDEIIVMAPLRRSVVRWDERKFAQNIDRLSRIARGAAMQSRRLYVPQVVGPVLLADVLSQDDVAVADPSGTADIGSVHTIVIGPEGGFDPDEIPHTAAHVSLGEHILRAETAAIVAATVMVAHRTRRSDHTG